MAKKNSFGRQYLSLKRNSLQVSKSHWVSSSQSHLSDKSCALQEWACLNFLATLSHCLEKLMGNVAIFECDHGFKSSVIKSVFLHSSKVCRAHFNNLLISIKRKILRAIQTEAKQLILETEKPEQPGCSGEV